VRTHLCGRTGTRARWQIIREDEAPASTASAGSLSIAELVAFGKWVGFLGQPDQTEPKEGDFPSSTGSGISSQTDQNRRTKAADRNLNFLNATPGTRANSGATLAETLQNSARYEKLCLFVLVGAVWWSRAPRKPRKIKKDGKPNQVEETKPSANPPGFAEP
jgi:hypothetical protein